MCKYTIDTYCFSLRIWDGCVRNQGGGESEWSSLVVGGPLCISVALGPVYLLTLFVNTGHFYIALSSRRAPTRPVVLEFGFLVGRVLLCSSSLCRASLFYPRHASTTRHDYQQSCRCSITSAQCSPLLQRVKEKRALYESSHVA